MEQPWTKPYSPAFEARFRRAARTVFPRRGFPEQAIESEIDRFLSLDIKLPVPSDEELEAELERENHRS